MAKLEFFLALKFLLNIKSEKSISTMIKICFISILVSSFALTLICAIMNGFEKETYKKLKGVHSDIIINSRSQEINFDRLKPVLFKEFGVYIKAASPFSIGQAILRSQNKNNKFHSLVMLKAVDPKSEFLVNNLDDMLLSTYKDQKDWNLLLKNKNIFIGETLAKNLHVNISDKIDLLYPDEDIEDNRILLHVEPVKIAGIFKTGMQELDEQVIMSSLNFFQDIFGHGPTGVNIKLKKEFKENDDILNKLRKRFKLDIFSWKD
ncbi:MAG: ABC transporter permease, partial [Novosphingobium sp.]|nr:ABC transporter permease [Novosphingobium sp.]